MIFFALSCVSSAPVQPITHGVDLRYAADFQVDVHGAPSEKGPALKSLEIGTPMEVTGPEQSGWLPVRVHGIKGFVPSGALTTAAGEQVNMWGFHETWAVSWGPDGHPLLRLKAQANSKVMVGFKTQRVEVSVPVTERFVGGTLTAGVDLWGGNTRFDITQCDVAPRTDGPRCSTGSASKVYQAAIKDERLTPITPPDAWRWSRDSPSIFDCKDPVELTFQGQETPEVRLELDMQSNARGPDTHVICSTFGEVMAGEWKGKPLVSCVERGREVRFARFIELDEAHWAHLGCEDDTYRDIAEALPWQKIRVSDAGPVVLAAQMRGPDVLWSDDVSQLKRKEHLLTDLPEGPVAFEHPTFGPVVRHAGIDTSTVFWIDEHRQPRGELGYAHVEGGIVSYIWTPNSLDVKWEAGAAPVRNLRIADPYFAVLSGKTAQFQKVGTLEGMDVFAHPTPSSLANQFRHSRPRSVVFVADPWGGLVALEDGS